MFVLVKYQNEYRVLENKKYKFGFKTKEEAELAIENIKGLSVLEYDELPPAKDEKRKEEIKKSNKSVIRSYHLKK